MNHIFISIENIFLSDLFFIGLFFLDIDSTHSFSNSF